jgi:hypothetical protein
MKWGRHLKRRRGKGNGLEIRERKGGKANSRGTFTFASLSKTIFHSILTLRNRERKVPRRHQSLSEGFTLSGVYRTLL